MDFVELWGYERLIDPSHEHQSSKKLAGGTRKSKLCQMN